MVKRDYENWDKAELIKEIEHLRKRKKFGLVWEDKPEDVVEQCKRELPVLEEVSDRAIIKLNDASTNLIIEGDNYHALSVLNYTHAGKVDVIYIDPPYNTGAANWMYNNRFVDDNDSYRHSKWLSMMSHRLAVAKNLLTDDGVLVCAIDENEYAHLHTLTAELFPSHEIHTVTVVHNPKGVQGANFSYTHEYALFVIPKDKKTITQRKLDESEIYISSLRNWGGESLRTDARNCFYPVIVKDDNIIGFGNVADNDYHPSSFNEQQDDGTVYVWPIDPQGIERKWRYARQSVESVRRHLRVNQSKNGYEIKIAKDFGTYRTVWNDKRYDASEYGTKLLRRIIPNCDFDFPKSLYTVFDCIFAVIANKPNSIILDFFAGSGTTGHAVMQLNKDDGGKRQFILCTNNENGIAEKVTYPRIKNVTNGYADVEGMPANVRYFKTSFVPKASVSDDTRYELVQRSADMICVREDTYNNVSDKVDYKIFENHEHYTTILFNIDGLQSLKTELANLEDKPVHLYIFSLTNDTHEADFDDIKQQHELCPIPESILEVYRRIFRSKSWN